MNVSFFFNDGGICKSIGIRSHGKQPTEVLDVGFSSKTGQDVCIALIPHFPRGSYDVLLKNCNSFTDCALFFLLGVRLQKHYSAVEKHISQKVGVELFQFVTQYKSNTKAIKFLAEDVIAILDGAPIEIN